METFSMNSGPHLISTDPSATPSISGEGTASGMAKSQRKAAMPRFFFHVRDESAFTSDEEGQQFPDLEAARLDALKAIEMLSADLPLDVAQRGIAFEITNERGQVVLTLPFRKADVPDTGRTAQIIQGPWGLRDR
jgi:hypothetical protein